MTVAELFEGLPDDRLVAIETFLGRTPSADRSKALQAFVIIGAWFAAIFLLGFLALADLVSFSHNGPDLLVGLLLICGAVFMAWSGLGLFTDQLALALSVAGHVLVLVAVAQHSLAASAVAACVLAAVLYVPCSSALHRFLSVGAALAILLVWAADDPKALALCLLLVVQLVALARVPSREHPLVYALAIMTLTTVQVIGSLVNPVPATIILTITLLAQARCMAPEMAPRVRALLYLAAVLLGALSAPGILGALALLVLAHDRDDPTLVAIALTFLTGFIIHFYYSLEMGLGVKSYILMASGVVLLAVRRFVR